MRIIKKITAMDAKVTAGVAVLAMLTLFMVFWMPFTSAGAASSTTNYLVTFYGWPDNSPPGGDIAYPVIHHSAGGTGTYSDPVTFATDRSELPVGGKVYVPFLHRYFIMEDDCTECDEDWAGNGPDGGPGLRHIDLWIGGEGAQSSQDVLHCEDSLTRNSAPVIIDPPPNEPVDTTPLFNSGNDACYNPSSFHPSPSPAPSTPSPSPSASPSTPSPSPSSPSSSASSAAPPPTQTASAADAPSASGSKFAAIAGPGCPQHSTATFAEHGQWTDARNGFIGVSAAGVTADGCDGSFEAMPVSGSASHDDPATYALWTFRTAPVTRGTCHIDVYVPSDTSLQHVGGHPAIYEVFDSASTSGPELGTFDIDQIFNRGRWASRHNWPVTSGTLTIKLDSRGVSAAGNGQAPAHIAISAISVTCV